MLSNENRMPLSSAAERGNNERNAHLSVTKGGEHNGENVCGTTYHITLDQSIPCRTVHR